MKRYIKTEPILTKSVGERPLHKRLLVVCEGKNTEHDYFDKFDIPGITIIPIGTGLSSTKLVKEVNVVKKTQEKRLKINKFDEIWVVFEKERNALGDFLTWINENIGKDSDWLSIKEIICYKDSYSDNAPKRFEVRKSDRVTLKPFQSDFVDLLTWEKLASFFDKKNYKKVLVDFKGKEQEVLCFECWQRDLEETEEQGVYLCKEWKYRKVLISVEKYVKLGDRAWYLDPKYIKSVKNYE